MQRCRNGRPQAHSIGARPTTHRPRRRAAAHAVTVPTFAPSLTVQKKDGYSLRLYEPFAAIETVYEKRADAYDALASYLGGMNAGNTVFQQTQPTILTYHGDGTKTMQLYVGPTKAGEQLADPPAPAMPGSRLVATGGELCAVLRFEGYITPTSADAALTRLQELLRRDGVRVAEGEGAQRFRICQYGMVHSTARENELLLRVLA